MQFIETAISGVKHIKLDKREDERGFFARLFCKETFAQHGIEHTIVQINESHNNKAGTLRGLHYQVAPNADAKLVRPIRGHMYDVVVDLRADSPSFMQWVGLHMRGETGDMLYIPVGCAHAFLTLSDHTDILYAVSAPYDPACERGLRYDDPAFNIAWPSAPQVITEKDKNWPDFAPEIHVFK